MENHDPEWGLIILGDMNGHNEIIGEQKVDLYGKMVLDWICEYDLILLNCDRECTGQYTWSRENRKSAIDFIQVNRKMYDIFKNKMR